MPGWRVAALIVLAAASTCARTPVNGPAAPVATTAGARPTRPAGPAVVSLEFVGAAMLPARTGGGAAVERVGGLSGCVNPAGDGRILAVSDNRRDPALVELEVRPGPPFEVIPGRITPLETGRATPGMDDDAGGLPQDPPAASAPAAPAARRPPMLDAEAVVVLDAGRLAVASEGNGYGVPPGLFTYDRDGRFLGAIPSPLAGRPGTRPGLPGGLRDNGAFEGLTRLPDGRLLVALEAPLEGDGPVAGAGTAAWPRIFELHPDARTWRPGREFAYRHDAVAADGVYRAATITAGISDILALDNRRLLVLERAFLVTLGLPPRSDNRIRIVQADLGTGQDVSGVPSLPGARVAPLDAHLVLDLDELRDRLPPELRRLENFEAMCPGPPLPDGRPSLLLVSDDNFNPGQRTAFLLLAVTDPPAEVTIR
jgi:hypothetical protein